MVILVEFIVQELTHPFQDPRTEFRTKLQKEDLFYKLTKESKYTLREESIVTVRITKIDSKALLVVTDSGVPGMIMLPDLKDKVNDISEGKIGEHYSVGEYLKAKICNINYELVRLRLTTDPEKMKKHKDFLSKNRILENYNLAESYSFTYDKLNDTPSLTTDK